MMYLTRRERFSAAHRLFRPEWTDEQNTAVFGGCANPNWHGHNYELFVTVKGSIDPETGFVINLKTLSKLIKNEVIDKLDHANINLDVDFMAGKLSSTEVLTKAIWEVLEPKINAADAQLHCIKIIETENNTVSYYGEHL
ncbi:MAG: 6-pyruvoyl trahydropterin synthase family protein [Flavobacteriales bacterium]